MLHFRNTPSWIVASLTGVAISATASNYSDQCAALAHAQCFIVAGERQVWNGWPPNLRIESSDKERVFGLPYSDDDALPKPIQAVVESTSQRAVGKFLLCPLGARMSVPYDDRPIEVVCFRSMESLKK